MSAPCFSFRARIPRASLTPAEPPAHRIPCPSRGLPSPMRCQKGVHFRLGETGLKSGDQAKEFQLLVQDTITHHDSFLLL